MHHSTSAPTIGDMVSGVSWTVDWTVSSWPVVALCCFTAMCSLNCVYLLSFTSVSSSSIFSVEFRGQDLIRSSTRAESSGIRFQEGSIFGFCSLFPFFNNEMHQFILITLVNIYCTVSLLTDICFSLYFLSHKARFAHRDDTLPVDVWMKWWWMCLFYKPTLLLPASVLQPSTSLWKSDMFCCFITEGSSSEVHRQSFCVNLKLVQSSHHWRTEIMFGC